MAMMISTEVESVPVATVIPDYVEEEGVSRPVEFTPDFEDAWRRFGTLKTSQLSKMGEV